jgi:Ser/Thr protein kinase RdoA (MazF antagonist)
LPMAEGAGAGRHEIVTHGISTERARRAEESTLQKLMTRVLHCRRRRVSTISTGQSARDLVAKANAEFAQLGVCTARLHRSCLGCSARKPKQRYVN